MSLTTETVIVYLIAFLVMGVFWVIVDRRKDQRFYRFVYSMTHEKPLPDGVEGGFIYKQPLLPVQLYVATFVSTVQLLLAAYLFDERPFVYLTIGVLGIPATLLGFFLGPKLEFLWKKSGDGYEVMKKVQSGEISVIPEMPDLKPTLEQIKDKASDLLPEVSDVTEALGKIKDRAVDCLSGLTKKQDEEPKDNPPTVDESPKVDGRLLIDKFVNGDK